MNDAEEVVILVDASDRQIGTQAKLAAHIDGNMHRAISIFLFNNDGDMLLQRRAAKKYHAGLKWANACCSHPRLNETPIDAAVRRLGEELNVTIPLSAAFQTSYRADVGDGLIEHEYVHAFVGYTEVAPMPNPDEVCETAFMPLAQIFQLSHQEPERFAPWFLFYLKNHPSELWDLSANIALQTTVK